MGLKANILSFPVVVLMNRTQEHNQHHFTLDSHVKHTGLHNSLQQAPTRERRDAVQLMSFIK